MKRLLLEEWDGRDFPAFVPRLFRKHAVRRRALPPVGRRHAGDARPAERSERAWERELERWGGERAFAEHWSRYRRLRHEFVRCDVLGDAARLLARVEPEQRRRDLVEQRLLLRLGQLAARRAERRRRYERWIEELAERNPRSLPVRVRLLATAASTTSGPAEYRVVLRGRRLRRARPAGSATRCEIRF